ncbi:MAG: YfcE family phosphodiesterase, partial [Sphingobacteriales bacterium]
DIRDEIYTNPPGLFITGHSHILKIMPDKARLPLLHINPGAAGKHGFHKVRTMVRFTVDGRQIKDLQVIELGSRTAISEEN